MSFRLLILLTRSQINTWYVRYKLPLWLIIEVKRLPTLLLFWRRLWPLLAWLLITKVALWLGQVDLLMDMRLSWSLMTVWWACLNSRACPLLLWFFSMCYSLDCTLYGLLVCKLISALDQHNYLRLCVMRFILRSLNSTVALPFVLKGHALILTQLSCLLFNWCFRLARGFLLLLCLWYFYFSPLHITPILNLRNSSW